jgi:putative ABC transport system permease protein
MWQKLIHKKWMVISLLIGNILLIAIAVSHPMYQEASLQRMLSDEFSKYMEENNEYPAELFMNSSLQKKDSQGFYKMKELATKVNLELGLDLNLGVEVYNVQESKAKALTERSDSRGEISIQITTINDLEDHVTLLSGRMYENEITDDGFIEVIMSESSMVSMDLLLNEEMEFSYLLDNQGQPIKLRIVGIFENSDTSDSYWFKSPDAYKRNCMMPYELFERIFLDPASSQYVIKGVWNLQFDYSKISVGQVDKVIDATQQVLDTNISNGKITAPNYLSVLLDFQI